MRRPAVVTGLRLRIKYTRVNTGVHKLAALSPVAYETVIGRLLTPCMMNVGMRGRDPSVLRSKFE